VELKDEDAKSKDFSRKGAKGAKQDGIKRKSYEERIF
jgi:hypothetical protein